MSSEFSKRPDDSLVTPHKPGSARYSADPGAGSPPPPKRPRRNFQAARFGKFALLLLLIALVLFVGAAGVSAFKSKRARVAAAVPSPAASPAAAPAREMATLQTLPVPRLFPRQDTVELDNGRWVTAYDADPQLEARSLHYLDQYRPEGAVVLVCDLRTGVIRSLAERDSGVTSSRPRLAVGNTFPAASLAKIITASAALEGGICRPTDNLPLLGAAHTLYRSQLRIPGSGRYPRVSLEKAFANSINPTFALLGLRLGSRPLREMAAKLGFNRKGEAPELESISRYEPADSGFELAEVACGFTTATTLSPLHALQIARAIGQDGRVLPVRFTRELHSLDGSQVLALPTGETPAPFLSAPALNSLRSLMEATVASGTARRGFRRNLSAQEFSHLDMGGKTGSLNGLNPKGRYEWFIGYARRRDNPDEGVAVAVMLINQTYLAVHATELAGLMIRDWWRYSDRPGSAAHVAAR